MNEKPPPKSHPPRSPFLRKGEEERMLRGAITPSAERGKKSERFTCDYPFRRKGSPRVPLGTCGGGFAVGRKAIPGKAIPLDPPSCGRGKKSGCFAERSSLPQKGGRRASASRAITPSAGRGRRACHSARAAGDALSDEKPSPEKPSPSSRCARVRYRSALPAEGGRKAKRYARAPYAPPFLRKGEEERTLRSALPAERGRKRTPLGHGGIFGRPVRQHAVTIIYRAGH